MNLTELNEILNQTGFPVAYSHFSGMQSAPFICYMVEGNPNFIADNKVYHKISDVRIELYTSIKDLAAETVLESLLDSLEVPYLQDETYIESEKLFQKIYEVRLI